MCHVIKKSYVEEREKRREKRAGSSLVAGL
jgi:hypothetical protein